MIPAAKSMTLRELVKRQIEHWRRGGRPDAAAVIAEHPELRRSKSLVMDLALAEFFFRNAAGDRVPANEFCERFPDYRKSIVRMLQVQDFLDQCPPFGADDRPRWPTPGDEFLGYEIIEPLGVGGLARVFLARENAIGRRFVVIKISRFGSREAHTLGKLSHPSIMPILSVQHAAEDGWTVICMPLVGVATAIDLLDAAFAKPNVLQGGEVVAHVARQTLPMAKVPCQAAGEAFDWHVSYAEAIARIGLQLAEALEAAHAAGILHRDIKPSNVLFAWSGRPLLLDFNLSTDEEVDGQGIGGTLAYMAPELVECLLHERAEAARRFDPRCDIYSLGVVLYELLTNRLPARPDDAEHLPLDAYEQWLAAKRRPAPALAMAPSPTHPLTPSPAAIDARLEAIVLKCLAPDAAARYASAAELAAELRAVLGSKAKRKLVRRRWALAAAAVGLAGAGLGYGAYVGNRPSPLETTYRQALAQYDEGTLELAQQSFTRCIELKPGWPDALFGRAQTFRRLGKWPEARTDFTALAGSDRAWAYALAGYCSLKMGDYGQGWSDHLAAYRAGLRHVSFLLNYARNETRRQKLPEVIKLYTEVLDIDPGHKMARQNRLWAHIALITNSKRLPGEEVFEDADACVRQEPHSCEAAYTTSYLYAAAARHDPNYEVKASAYLEQALRLGLPLDRVMVPGQANPLKRLVPFVDANVLLAERPAAPQFQRQPLEISDPPMTAHWETFQRQSGRASHLAVNP